MSKFELAGGSQLTLRHIDGAKISTLKRPHFRALDLFPKPQRGAERSAWVSQSVKPLRSRFTPISGEYEISLAV
jgi:hypothetical protein